MPDYAWQTTETRAGTRVFVECEHTARSLGNLLTLTAAKGPMLYKAAGLSLERRIALEEGDEKALRLFAKYRPDSVQGALDIWRAAHPAGGFVEVLEDGAAFTYPSLSIQSAVQLSVAMVKQAARQRSVCGIVRDTPNPKYAFRCWLLQMGMSGPEYSDCRAELLRRLPGDIAYAKPEQNPRLAQVIQPQEQEIEQEPQPALEPEITMEWT
ncbi:hypothetical protein LJC34_07230 [Oscillospiraceae bacterium OttesenSCG-928-G22]|nr:hypothetical protein [Oscillospiraceae bacterium OttesenSCG-928-G22]